METHWFYTVWPFIGVGGALVMLAILLLTDTFRGSTTGSRFRDPMWLAWLAVPFYWLHQFEEYSLPVLGIHYSIQEMICEKIGFPPYPECPIPLAFYPVVNIALMWFGAPLAAYLFRRNVLIGLSFWGLLFANGLVHTLGGVTERTYNTGLVTAVTLVCSVLDLGPVRVCDSRAIQRQSRRRCLRRWSPHTRLAFHGLRTVQGRGVRQRGSASLCRRNRFHADHLGSPCEPVFQASVVAASSGAVGD